MAIRAIKTVEGRRTMTNAELEIAAQAADRWPVGVAGTYWGWEGVTRPWGLTTIGFVPCGHG